MQALCGQDLVQLLLVRRGPVFSERGPVRSEEAEDILGCEPAALVTKVGELLFQGAKTVAAAKLPKAHVIETMEIVSEVETEH